jgi:CubicO group peptidase (beta-lactamase class C family)
MPLAKQADTILQNAIRAGDAAGVIAGATDGGGTIYEGAFGERVAGHNANMSPDTVVWLASMTKAVVGTAAMQLVERSRLELDVVLHDIVPELGALQVLEGFDENERPRLRPARHPITLRHLLTHTAGFG